MNKRVAAIQIRNKKKIFKEQQITTSFSKRTFSSLTIHIEYEILIFLKRLTHNKIRLQFLP